MRRDKDVENIDRASSTGVIKCSIEQKQSSTYHIESWRSVARAGIIASSSEDLLL